MSIDPRRARSRLVHALCLGLLTALTTIECPAAGAFDERSSIASVVQVGVWRANGRLAAGSAVVVAPGLLVTACHGTRDAAAIVLMHGVEQLPVRSVVEDYEHDLCLLSAPSIRGRVPEFGDTARLRVGDEVIAVGFSSGMRLRASAGEVKALYGYDGARVMRTSAWFSTGASGGGLFDREGRLVGVLSFKSTAGDDHHYAMPVEWIDTLLLRRADARSPTTAAFWERDAASQPAFVQAAWLEGTQAWAELARVAQVWTQQQPHEVEAWLALARGLAQLAQPQAASDALAGAASLDPLHAGLHNALNPAPPQPGPAPGALPTQAAFPGESPNPAR